MGLQHADQCPSCSRAVRLIRGVIRIEDLYPESDSGWMDDRAGVMAILLHPMHESIEKRLIRALGSTALSVVPMHGWCLSRNWMRSFHS